MLKAKHLTFYHHLPEDSVGMGFRKRGRKESSKGQHCAACYGMNVSPQNLYVEILTLKLMVVRSWNFGRYWCHENEFLMNGIRALIKETPQNFLVFLQPYEDERRWQSSIEKETSAEPNHADALIIDFLTSQIMRKNYVVYKTPSLW